MFLYAFIHNYPALTYLFKEQTDRQKDRQTDPTAQIVHILAKNKHQKKKNKTTTNKTTQNTHKP